MDILTQSTFHEQSLRGPGMGEWYRMMTVVGAGESAAVHDVGQVELSHRDVLVLLDRRVAATRPDVDHFVFRVAICTRRLTPSLALLLPVRVTEYWDERVSVCVSVSLSVCPRAYL